MDDVHAAKDADKKAASPTSLLVSQFFSRAVNMTTATTLTTTSTTTGIGTAVEVIRCSVYSCAV